MRLSFLLRWLVVFGLGAVALSASGTRMVPLSIEELSTQAALVVHGRVVALETARDDSGRILTRIQVQPSEVWKGRVSGGLVEIVAGGGILGDRAVSVAGQAVYAVDEEIVAFLVRNPAGELVTLGLGQGRFAVRTEAATGQRWVSNVFWGAADVGERGAEPEEGPRPRLPRSPLTLDELRRRTRGASQ